MADRHINVIDALASLAVVPFLELAIVSRTQRSGLKMELRFGPIAHAVGDLAPVAMRAMSRSQKIELDTLRN